MATRAQIENAFQPSREVVDARRFAGRSKQVEQCYTALLSTGANVAIIGNRGVGKSSLARQIVILSQGKTALLDKLDIPADSPLSYKTAYYACGSEVSNISDLLVRLLTSSDCLGSQIYDIVEQKKIGQKVNCSFSAKLLEIIGISVGGESSNEEQRKAIIKEHPIDIIFSNVLSELSDESQGGDGILIVIDEYDQIKDKSGFATLMKSCATNLPRVKFCIVGVAQDIKELINEHQSSDRLFVGSIVKVPPMSNDELYEIVDIAEEAVNNEFKFTDSARNKMATLAQGHPYIMHLLGKFSLRAAHKNQRTTVEETEIQAALQEIANEEADPILEGRYRKAVATSNQREVVLKALAEHLDGSGEVWTKDAYRKALDLGVDNASQYVGQLVTDDYGAEIKKVQERCYSFKDSLFAAYVNARPYMTQPS